MEHDRNHPGTPNPTRCVGKKLCQQQPTHDPTQVPASRPGNTFDHHPSGPQTVPQSSSSSYLRTHFSLPGCPNCSEGQPQSGSACPMAGQRPCHGGASCHNLQQQQKWSHTWIHTWGKHTHGMWVKPWGEPAPREIPHILLSSGSSHSHDSQLTFKISLNSWLIYFISRASNLWKYILKNQTECTLLIAGPFSDILQSKWAFVPSGVLSHDWTPIKALKISISQAH